MQSGSALTRIPDEHEKSGPYSVRPIDYGRLVRDLSPENGESVIEPQGSGAVALRKNPRADVIHHVSVASGYIGLAAGFLLVGAGLFWQVT